MFQKIGHSDDISDSDLKVNKMGIISCKIYKETGNDVHYDKNNLNNIIETQVLNKDNINTSVDIVEGSDKLNISKKLLLNVYVHNLY